MITHVWIILVLHLLESWVHHHHVLHVHVLLLLHHVRVYLSHHLRRLILLVVQWLLLLSLCARLDNHKYPIKSLLPFKFSAELLYYNLIRELIFEFVINLKVMKDTMKF